MQLRASETVVCSRNKGLHARQNGNVEQGQVIGTFFHVTL
jgi:hypothetical protein